MLWTINWINCWTLTQQSIKYKKNHHHGHALRGHILPPLGQASPRRMPRNRSRTHQPSSWLGSEERGGLDTAQSQAMLKKLGWKNSLLAHTSFFENRQVLSLNYLDIYRYRTSSQIQQFSSWPLSWQNSLHSIRNYFLFQVNLDIKRRWQRILWCQIHKKQIHNS